MHPQRLVFVMIFVQCVPRAHSHRKEVNGGDPPNGTHHPPWSLARVLDKHIYFL